MLQERDQVRGSDYVHRAANAVVVVGRHRQSHKPAIAAARNHYLPGIQIGLGLNPVQKGTDVLVRSLAQESVVQFLKRLAISSRAAHVRINHRNAQLVDVVIVVTQEIRTNLPFRSAVNVNDHRSFAGELRRWLVKKRGDGTVVPRLPMDQLLLRESRSIQTASL